MPANAILDLQLGDIIDLRGLSFQTGATATYAGDTLTIVSGGESEQLTLLNPAETAFSAPTPDGSGGTEVNLETPPVESGFDSTTTEAVQGGGAVTLLAFTPTVTDANSTTLAGATVEITGGYQSGDVLGVTTTGTITVQSDSDGTLVLSGTASIADYEQVLASVTYQDTGTDNITVGHPNRTISWTVNDGTLSSSPVMTRVTIDRPPVATAATNTALVSGPRADGNVLTMTAIRTATR